jgi:protein TonB
MQQQGPAQTAENQNPAAGAQNAPAPSSDESVSYEEAALDPPPQVDSAHDAPRGGPDLPRTPAARQTAAATPPPAPDHAAQQTRDLNAAALSGPVAPVPLTPAPAPVVFVEPTPVVTAPTAAALPARAPGRVSWAAQPPASRIAALYPSRALRTGQNGSARLDCAVRTDFGLSCTIAQESPQGMGFGQAALRAAASFRANRNLSNGDSASGARTSITIRFQGG